MASTLVRVPTVVFIVICSTAFSHCVLKISNCSCSNALPCSLFFFKRSVFVSLALCVLVAFSDFVLFLSFSLYSASCTNTTSPSWPLISIVCASPGAGSATDRVSGALALPVPPLPLPPSALSYMLHRALAAFSCEEPERRACTRSVQAFTFENSSGSVCFIRAIAAGSSNSTAGSSEVFAQLTPHKENSRPLGRPFSGLVLYNFSLYAF